jgi:phospholipid-translocating ATPase
MKTMLEITECEEPEVVERLLQEHLATLNVDLAARANRIKGEDDESDKLSLDQARLLASPGSPALTVTTARQPHFSGRHGHFLLIDGKSVRLALLHSRELLRQVSVRCNAVIGCRLSPLQKAMVVRMVKDGPPPKGPWLWQQPTVPITLSIGDGANDVAMIQEAHVGVAILGKEGRQAARASDYAFGQFRMLARLLLVHGSYSYRRVAYTLQYFFYKEIVFILPVALYGNEALFSGEPLFDSWLLVFWNILFSAGPVLAFGAFAKDLDPDVLMSYPQLHSTHANNALLSLKEFGLWIAHGVCQAFVAYLGVWFAFSDSSIVRVFLCCRLIEGYS